MNPPTLGRAPAPAYPTARAGADEAGRLAHNAASRAYDPDSCAEDGAAFAWALCAWALLAEALSRRAHGDAEGMRDVARRAAEMLAEGAVALGIDPDDYARCAAAMSPPTVRVLSSPLPEN